MKTAPMGFVALAFLAGIVWLWSRSVEPVLPLTALDGGAAGSGSAAAAEASLDGMPQQVPQRQAVAPGTLTDGSELPEVQRDARLEVVDEFGVPVPDAEVWYLPPVSDSERKAADADMENGDDGEVSLRRHGRSTRSDQNGLVDLTIEPDSLVTARRGDTFGSCWPQLPIPGMPRERMALVPDVHLRVQVVDGDGAPVRDVGVFAASEGRSRRRGVFGDLRRIGPTDVDGWVRIPHLQELLTLPRPSELGELRLGLGTGPNILRSDLTIRALPASALHGDVEVRLVTPGHGNIDVTTCDADGEPLGLNVALESATGEGFADRGASSGVSRFSLVPLGRRWQLVAWHPWLGMETPQDRKLVDGPRTANETVTVDLRLMVREFSFRARIIDRDGMPVSGVKVESVHPRLAWDTQTGTDGKLHLGPFVTGAEVVSMDLALRVSSPSINARQFSFDVPFAKGMHDFGDLVVDRLAQQPLLASIELRCRGEPVLGSASVELELHVAGAGQSPQFEPASATVRRDGARFEFRGALPEQPMRVTCYSDDCVPQRIGSLSPGAHRVVDLHPAASLVLAIEAPDVPIKEIYGELRPLGIREGEGQVEGDPLRTDPLQQVLRWMCVPPGRYSVRLAIGGGEIWSCPSLELQPGNNRLPADGSRLDLRSRAAARLLRVRSAEHGDDPGAKVIAVAARADALPPEGSRHELRDWFVLREPRDDLLVAAPGHIPVRVPAPSADVEVTLQPSSQVELDIDGEFSSVRGRLVHDPLPDPLLRAFDEFNIHAAEFNAGQGSLYFVPGAIVEFWLELDGKRGEPVRVTVGPEPASSVQLR